MDPGNSQYSHDWRKKCQSGTVPKGDRFTEGVSADDVRATLGRVKVANNLDAGLVMLACLWRRRGEDGAWMADMLQVPRSTIIHGWLTRMHRGGLDARYGCHDDPEITAGRLRR